MQEEITMESTGEANDQGMLALDCPPSTPDFLGKVGLNLALGLVTSCCGHQTTCWIFVCCCLGP